MLNYYNTDIIITCSLVLIVSTLVAYVSKRMVAKLTSASKQSEETYACQIYDLTMCTQLSIKITIADVIIVNQILF